MIVVVKHSRVSYLSNDVVDEKDETVWSGWLLFFVVNFNCTYI